MDTSPTVGQPAPHIRAAGPADVMALHRFIAELAETQQLPEPITATPNDLDRALFGARPVAEAVVATVGADPVGFALFFGTYSTVLGRPGIHLEDLYVRPEHRGGGLGLAMLAHLARLTVERGGSRLEWWVLRTNVDALRFYRRLDAHALDIELLRLAGLPLATLADSRLS